MTRRPTSSKRPATLFPDTTLFRSARPRAGAGPVEEVIDGGLGEGQLGNSVEELLQWGPRVVVGTGRLVAGDGAPHADHGLARRHQRSVPDLDADCVGRSEEHTPELQSLMRHPYAAFCLK